MSGAHPYRLQHTTSDDGSPLYNLSLHGTYPADVYTHPHLYVNARDEHDVAAMEVIRVVHGQPERMVPIYRALPPGITVINDGDWVSITESYARQHAMQNDDPGDDFPVIVALARADQLRTAAEGLNEWGYFGPTLTAAVLPRTEQ